jgi:hypothetical protein
VERTTIAGETEVLGENLPQRHFVPPQIPHDQVRFRTPDHSGGKPATNCLSYGAAICRLRQTLYLHMWDDADVFVHVHVQHRNIDPLTAKCKVSIAPAYSTSMGRTRQIYILQLINMNLKLIRPTRTDVAITFHTLIREVLGSNLNKDIGYTI